VNEEAKELLTRAANYLAEHGHTKGAFEVDDGAVCADGALQKVCSYYESNAPTVMYTARELLAFQMAKEDPKTDGYLKRWLRYGAVSRADVFLYAIWGYNDRDETTAEDVVLAMKRAAECGEG